MFFRHQQDLACGIVSTPPTTRDFGVLYIIYPFVTSNYHIMYHLFVQLYCIHFMLFAFNPSNDRVGPEPVGAVRDEELLALRDVPQGVVARGPPLFNVMLYVWYSWYVHCYCYVKMYCLIVLLHSFFCSTNNMFIVGRMWSTSGRAGSRCRRRPHGGRGSPRRCTHIYIYIYIEREREIDR